MTERAGCIGLRTWGSARQHPVDPAQEGMRSLRRRRRRGERLGWLLATAIPARARRQIPVHGVIAHLRHEGVAAALGDEDRDLGFGIAQIAEMPRRDWACCDAGGLAI